MAVPGRASQAPDPSLRVRLLFPPSSCPKPHLASSYLSAKGATFVVAASRMPPLPCIADPIRFWAHRVCPMQPPRPHVSLVWCYPEPATLRSLVLWPPASREACGTAAVAPLRRSVPQPCRTCPSPGLSVPCARAAPLTVLRRATRSVPVGLRCVAGTRRSGKPGTSLVGVVASRVSCTSIPPTVVPGAAGSTVRSGRCCPATRHSVRSVGRCSP